MFLCMCVFTLFVKQRKFIEQNKLDVECSILYVPVDGTNITIVLMLPFFL